MKLTDELRAKQFENAFNRIQTLANDVRMSLYEQAVEEKNEDKAAEAVRAIRDVRLADSDKYATVDRPTSEEWLAYRQELRDLPQQEGFPFDVAFPETPAKSTETESLVNQVSAVVNDSITALEGVAELYEMMLGGS